MSEYPFLQAVIEIYNLHGSRIKANHAIFLLDTLQEIAMHAHKANADSQLRLKLQKLQMLTQLPDPPFLRLENESYLAYLTILQNLPLDKPALAQVLDFENRLVELCKDVLQVYLNTASVSVHSLPQKKNNWTIPLGSSRRRELTARAPLVVATLKAFGGLTDSSLEKYLRQFFPLLASLISCEHGSGEVQIALSDMFSSWIGPILLRSVC
jgi:brefeldin A-inhibited guanine nucleotide-exchange protein